MAKLSLVLKQRRAPKFKTQGYNRGQNCGRTRGYYRKCKICRICLRELASKGEIPGMIKASW